MSIPRQPGWWGLGWLLAAWLGVAAAPAPPASAAPAKYLFVVEASAVTAPYAERVALVVADLIERGCGGRMQGGDVFNILPFNEQMDPVGYTRKVWDPAQSRPISNLAFLYLQKYKFEKKPRWDLVLALVQQVVREERDLNLYLVVSGLQPILGTPFDAEINAVLREQAESWRTRRGVGVIALVAERGRLVDWAVGAAEPPAPVRLLARMPEPPPPKLVSPAPPAVAQTSAPPAQVTNVQKTAVKPPPKPVPPPTNTVAQVTPPPPPPPKPESASPPKEQPPPQPSVAEPKPPEVPEPPKVSVIQTSAPVVQKPAPAPPQPVPPPKVEEPPRQTPSISSTGAAGVVSPPAPPATAQTQALVTVPLQIIAPQTSPETASGPGGASTTMTAKVEGPSGAPTNAPPPAPPVQTVAMVPPPARTPLGLLAAGVGLLGLAVWLVIIWHRRTRPAAAPSLITQSMERERRKTGPEANQKRMGP
ncbi:MAG: hypothetical protein N3J91_07605 [Verrucomicrobiae bacterium]|nr:hypothetical protein [Verrucomicrobiae bacterium]